MTDQNTSALDHCPFVELGRHFHELNDKELGDAELLASFNEVRSWGRASSWDEVLKKRRVVILASAGSGKTREMMQAMRSLVDAKKAAFYVRLEALALEDFDRLLKSDELMLFNQWKSDHSSEGWFFLDSVDELKLTQRTLENAFRNLHRAVANLLHRASIIVSSRPTDWRSNVDGAKFQEWLPAQPVVEVVDHSSEDLFLDVLRRRGALKSKEKQTRVEHQDPAVATLLLLPLSENQIRVFSQRQGVANPDAFMNEIARTNAWAFARRPLDLIDLIVAWNSTSTLGTKQDQHKLNLQMKLRDRPDRKDAGHLSTESATDGAERLALAMALTRRRSIKPPDSLVVDSPDGVLDPSELLRQWSTDQVSALLRRAVFDPATLGRVRFHHQSIQEFLAARRLHKLRQMGMSVGALFRLLFADMYGEKVAIPSMTAIAAWLALWDPDVFRELLAICPESLISHGDPGSLTLGQRESIINAYVGRYSKGGWRGIRFPSDQLRRIASPDFGNLIKTCWGGGPENREVRELLLDLIALGPVLSCCTIAYDAAVDPNEDLYLRIDAVRALVACGANSQLKTLAGRMTKQAKHWPDKLVATVLAELFPTYMSEDSLMVLLKRHQSHDLGEMSAGFEWALDRIVSTQAVRPSIRRRLTALVTRAIMPGATRYDVQNRYRDYCPVLAKLCLSELEETEGDPSVELLESCVVAYHLFSRDGSEQPINDLRSWLAGRPELTEKLFWMEMVFMAQATTVKSGLELYSNISHHSLCELEAGDVVWLEKVLLENPFPERQEFALHAWINLWAIGGRKPRMLSNLHRKLNGRNALLQVLDSRTAKAKDSAVVQKFRADAKRRQAEWDEEERLRLERWEHWHRDLIHDPESHFAPSRMHITIQNLFHWMERREESRSSHCVWDYSSLVKVLGPKVAALAKEAFKQHWRAIRPKLWTEREESKRSGTPYLWLHGLCGVMAEAESPGWASRLTSHEVRLATRYATIEMNRFPSFMEELSHARPSEVQLELQSAILAELRLGGQYSHLPLLQHVTHADAKLKHLVAPTLESFLLAKRNFAPKTESNHWHHNLGQVLGILRDTGASASSKRIGRYCIRQLKSGKTSALSMVWLRGAFQFLPEEASDALIDWLRIVPPSKDHDSPAIKAIASLFGDWNSIGLLIADHDVRAQVLDKLIRLAYRFVRPENDEEHDGVFQPLTRDHAERGRSYLLSSLLDTPGRVARDVILALSKEHDFRSFSDRLRHLAIERAAKDAEFEAWLASEIEEFDHKFELPPRGRDAMHRILIDRLEDLQHALDHDEFSNRDTLRRIEEEPEMQRNLAQRLDAMSRGCYAVEREPEVVDRKKPDIRLRSSGDGIKASIEVKIADNDWSWKDLEDALRKQLVGQYLRHESCKAGCLLLTFAGRKKKWNHPSLGWISAAELVPKLNEVADKIMQENTSVKLHVCGLRLYPE